MTATSVRLPDGRVWLRVADPDWDDPLDPSFAREAGGRWNALGSFATLYMNGDVRTARRQIERMLAGSPVLLEDLEYNAFVLVAARLPRAQTVADAVTNDGLEALNLPASYPLDAAGQAIARSVCQPIGLNVRERRLRGIWCRSAAEEAGNCRELAWFPATRRSVARVVWELAKPFGEWRDAVSWTELGLGRQPDPA